MTPSTNWETEFDKIFVIGTEEHPYINSVILPDVYKFFISQLLADRTKEVIEGAVDLVCQNVDWGEWGQNEKEEATNFKQQLKERYGIK